MVAPAARASHAGSAPLGRFPLLCRSRASAAPAVTAPSVALVVPPRARRGRKPARPGHRRLRLRRPSRSGALWPPRRVSKWGQLQSKKMVVLLNIFDYPLSYEDGASS